MDIAPEWEHGRELLLGIATGIRETGVGGGAMIQKRRNDGRWLAGKNMP